MRIPDEQQRVIDRITAFLASAPELVTVLDESFPEGAQLVLNGWVLATHWAVLSDDEQFDGGWSSFTHDPNAPEPLCYGLAHRLVEHFE